MNVNRGIALLKEVSRDLDAVERVSMAKLPQGVLRFHLEYPYLPDLDTARTQITNLLGHDNLELFSLLGDDKQPIVDSHDNFGHFVVLQFPALERTLSQRSLFDIAYALEDTLKLVSAEPELANRIYQDPEHRDAQGDQGTEGVIEDAFTANCWVKKPAPENRSWPLETMRIKQAWEYSDTRGEGIIIAQPDTGIAQHDELQGATVRYDLGINLVEDTDDPTDPLKKTDKNPGHGTATSSVIVGQGNSNIQGAAPGAELVPIRCVDDVRIFDASPVVAAINHARTIDCHVITLSLGGLRNRALKKAINSAIANNIIVVSAAGNCIEIVVWPARHNAVIGIGGTNIDDIPWQGSSRGSDVDLSAPAEHVWVARRKPGQSQTDVIEAAQGTSFATALTAGVAALWLSHHGRDRLIEVAQNSKLSLQSLFRLAVQATARQPDNWSVDDYGAGIVDAEALLKLAPEKITHNIGNNKKTPDRIPSSAEYIFSSFDRKQASESSSNQNTTEHRFLREISAINFESARLGYVNNSISNPENAFIHQELSLTLKEALVNSTDPAFVAMREKTGTPPAAQISHAIGSVGSDNLINRMQSGNPESGVSSNTTNSFSSLNAVSTRNLLDDLEKQIDNSPIAQGSSTVSRDSLKQEVLTDTEEVLQKILTGKKIAPDDTRSNTAYEALVKMQGRPVIRLDEEPIDLNDPNLQKWVGKIGLMYNDLPQLSSSVGRIDVDGIHHGTGFVVAPGIVMTNRHVVEGFAAPLPSANRPDRWLFEQRATINFSPQANDIEKEFIIHDVLFSGPDRISGDPLINHDELDLAFVAVEETNSAGKSLPKPLDIISPEKTTAARNTVFLIGYPAAPSTYPKDENGRFRIEVVQRLRELFGVDFGRCYLSPGMVQHSVTGFKYGTRPISFAHDATSLGGSSGSCVINFCSNPAVLGLHYGGDWLRANFAHDLAHVSRTLIKIPELTSRLASIDAENREQLRSAAQTSKVDIHINLSASHNVGERHDRA